MERRAIAVRGTVQGVGFRPFVYRLASELQLGGFVSNDAAGVVIEVEGEAESIDQLQTALFTQKPPLAQIDAITARPMPILVGDASFQIKASDRAGESRPSIVPDIATCEACLAELFDPANRRYRYPFLNCTNCGPRLTIVTGVPYDRERTTMATFEMCEACRAEYENPADRRFHAQPTACALCGPTLSAANATRGQIQTEDPIAWFAQAIRDGMIGAMKGLGGYHLVCDARNDEAVKSLRLRKHRDEKPFAVMVADAISAQVFSDASDAERTLLQDIRRPIVLLSKRGSSELSGAVAPRNTIVGVMLPYTPLHHLLMREVGFPLVMTSGNRADEPIAIGEPEVFERLAGIADVYLTHNRPIHVRCDDSVKRIITVPDIGVTRESAIRRSRGEAPRPISLPLNCDVPILAVGGQMKGTFALGRDRQAIVSHHLGDLDEFEAYRAFEKDISLYEKLFSITPTCIAHDLHPDYASTRYARKRAAASGATLIPVQHHHAHMASCMAENGIDEQVIGVCFDGTGYGADGAIWGGEFLVGDFAGFNRAAHFRYVPMPGGNIAVKQPWRMALSHLLDAEADSTGFETRLDKAALRIVRQMIDRRLNAPLTSSVGRLFDAVAAIVGIRNEVSYEGQAAVELETLAQTNAIPCSAYDFCTDTADRRSVVIDTRLLIRAIAKDVDRGVPAGEIAAKFHAALVDIIASVCQLIRQMTGISTVALSGGVFMNTLLNNCVEARLKNLEFLTLVHSTVPANDGGLSLGQLAIAARLSSPSRCSR